MNLAEYAAADAVELGRLVRAGEVSPAELAVCAAEGVAIVDGRLNAVAELYGDRIADGDPQAAADGVFAGVPFMLKDAGAMEQGRGYELGSRLFKGNVARATSTLTHLFKQAGLVNIGRTTSPEGALAGTTESVLHGLTRNPWDTTLSTGGSSGGAAALVAAGVLPIAHGSDGAGSIRMPAALCGLVGLKPSRGRTSLGPLSDEMGFGTVSEFVLSRTVRDTAAALDATAAPQAGDPFVIAPPERPWLREVGRPIDGVRVGFTTTNWRTGLPVDPEVADSVTATAKALEQLGCHVEEAEPTFDKEATYAFNAFCFNVNALVFGRVARSRGVALTTDVVEPVIVSAMRKMEQLSGDDVLRWLGRANPIRRQIGAFFEDFDLLLTPTVPLHRLPLGVLGCSDFEDVDAFRRLNEELQFAFTCPFNITGQPAVSLPVGTAPNGHPIGVQLVARFGNEAGLIRAGSALEAAIPWAGRRPVVHVASAAS